MTISTCQNLVSLTRKFIIIYKIHYICGLSEEKWSSTKNQNMRQYLKLFDLSQKVDYKTEVLSGLTVALALVPEAVAFALIAGLEPLTGLYAAFVMGLVTAILVVDRE